MTTQSRKRHTWRSMVAGLTASTALLLTTSALADDTSAATPLYNPAAPAQTFPAHVADHAKKFDGLCAPVTGPGPSQYANRRVQALNTLMEKTPLGRHAWEQAAGYEKGPAWICFTPSSDMYAFYYTGTGVLVLNSDLPEAEHIAAVPHELRHLEQERRGFTADALGIIDEDDRLHLQLAKEADAETFATLTLWEQKQAGNSIGWDAHNNTSLCPDTMNNCYAMISKAFEAAVTADPDAIKNGTAARAAFREWYADLELLDRYERHHYGYMGRAQHVSPRGSVPSHTVPSDDFAKAVTGLGSLAPYGFDYLGADVAKILKQDSYSTGEYYRNDPAP
ncbi:DUF6782 family putative metallopeptidase [Micavibrio aeruginosavorus]|uniref:DUF6782 family putative metallopeptidase n=1 Tax=Micavibrio aeruginosavorus TaxID=349221 RepID=UPI003F4AB7D2